MLFLKKTSTFAFKAKADTAQEYCKKLISKSHPYDETVFESEAPAS